MDGAGDPGVSVSGKRLLQVFRAEPGFLGNAGEHFRTDLVRPMEGEDVIGPAVPDQYAPDVRPPNLGGDGARMSPHRPSAQAMRSSTRRTMVCSTGTNPWPSQNGAPLGLSLAKCKQQLA